MLKTLAYNARRLATLARDPSFAKVEASDLRVFESICGSNYVKTSDIDNYKTDWTKAFKGDPPCVLLPSSTEEVSAILAHCARRRIAVVPQAGNTGLVGGSIPLHDEIVLSVKRINKHFEFDETSGILSCDAGMILELLDNRLAPYGYMMPFDLGAKGSCMIGGNVATSAGGIRLLRYGSLHAHLLGLTAVLPTEEGTIVELGSAHRKDNTSLHTPHLFLGSEGQLGVITRVTMSAVPKPASVQSAMLGVDTFESCCKVLRMAKRHLSEILSSFEFLDREASEVLDEALGLKPVLQSNPRFTILVETSGSNAAHDSEKMEKFLDDCISSGSASDGVQAQSIEEASAMWRLRESAPLAVAADGFVYKNDVSLPLKHFYRLTEEIRTRCSSLAKRIVTYGHLGDGNSHLNITAKGPSQELYDRLYPFLYEWVNAHGGSISAEHGIGQLKLPYASLGKSPMERDLVRRVKAVFDPKSILNPYKSF
uniref:D-2-hydroxyglutarate dehydrogenase, mitochondrial n=1 Tax=Haemonchus contortus TaxID=6289 RepID=A0A7I5E736_HAECO